MLYPFTTYQSAHITSLSDFYHYSSFSQSIQMCCFFTFCLFPPKHHSPVPMPTVSGRLFRCTGMEAAEMCHHWECRRREELCVWRDAQRKKRVGCRDVYKEELSGAQSTARSDTHTDSVISERRADWKRSKPGSLKSSLIKQNPQDWILNSSHWLSIVFHIFLLIFFIFCIIYSKTCGDSWSDTPESLTKGCKSYILRHIYSRASLSTDHHPHIWATVHHGDQHGHAPCPSAAFGDGGVPPVSGHSLCLQGWTTWAPPPLRTVWHHWGGGGGLLHPGGGPSPALLPADRGEPEEEHQMSSSRRSSSTTVTCLTYLASLQPVWRPTDVNSIMDADCWLKTSDSGDILLKLSPLVDTIYGNGWGCTEPRR